MLFPKVFNNNKITWYKYKKSSTCRSLWFQGSFGDYNSLYKNFVLKFLTLKILSTNTIFSNCLICVFKMSN